MLRRLIGMIVFAVHLLLPGTTRRIDAPDLIIGSTVHPFAAWAAMRLARRYRVPFIYEVRDVWPETLIDLGKLSSGSLAARVFRVLARSTLKRASAVVSPLPNVDQYIAELGHPGMPFRWISNGVSLSGDQPAFISRPIGEPFVFMYMGSHGNANALEGVLEAFDAAARERPHIRLRLVGDGPQKQALIEAAARLSSRDSITFEDWVPESDLPGRASEADCFVANSFDRPVYRFGVSLNKFFTYMGAVRPVVWASSAPNNPVGDAHAGLTVPGDDRRALADAMIRMVDLPVGDRRRMAESGYLYVASGFRHEVLAAQLASALDEVAALSDLSES